MNIEILQAELSVDPLGRGYSSMTDQEAADSLNTANRTRTRTTLTSAEIYEALDVTEFQSKTDAQKTYVRDILGLGGNIAVGPNTKARTVMMAIFGAQSTTITNLAALLPLPSISRAAELGLPNVGAHHVAEARQ